jgi:hypothetical protein
MQSSHQLIDAFFSVLDGRCTRRFSHIISCSPVIQERITLDVDNVFHVKRGIGRGPGEYSAPTLDPKGGRQGYFQLMRIEPRFMKQIWFQTPGDR